LACMKPDMIQLEFRCPECDASGLTPELPDDKAIAVTLRNLRLRCPRCSAIIEVTEPLARVMLKARVERRGEPVASVVREALKELERRAANAERYERVRGQPKD
jgi:hypothetical protein